MVGFRTDLAPNWAWGCFTREQARSRGGKQEQGHCSATNRIVGLCRWSTNHSLVDKNNNNNRNIFTGRGILPIVSGERALRCSLLSSAPFPCWKSVGFRGGAAPGSLSRRDALGSKKKSHLLVSPPKPFTVTISCPGEGLFAHGGEGKSLWDTLGWKGWEWVVGQLLTPRVISWALLFPNSTGLGVSTPCLQLPCRGGNEAGSVCLENHTDLRRFPLLQIPPLRGAWKTLLFIVHSTGAQRDTPEQTSYQFGGGILSSSVAPRCPVPSPREVGNHTRAPPPISPHLSLSFSFLR